MIYKRLLRFGAIATCVALLALSGCGITNGQGGTPRTYRFDWEQEAADGDKDAQYKLGRSYCCGRGRSYNTDLAIAWLCRAAIQGQVESQYELANIFANQLSPASSSRTVATDNTDFEKAYMWYTLAARLGHQQAFANRERIGNMMSKSSVLNGKRLAAQWHDYVCPSVEAAGG